MSLLEVSVQAGDLGPVIVLAGDADGSSVTQLNEALTAQVSGQTTHLTIDATDLLSIDPATAQALTLAALIVMVRGGSTVLVNPQEHKLDGSVMLRPAPAEPGTSNSGSETYEVICRICGDDPGLDHQEVSPELQQIRGPYMLSVAVVAFVKHDELHNGTCDAPVCEA